jgi:hypothetical protein
MPEELEISSETEILHDIAKLLEINIVNKSFFVPLNQIQSITKFHFDISINDSIFLEDDGHYMTLKTIQILVLGDSDAKLANFNIIYSFQIESDSGFIIEHRETYEIKESLNEWLENIVLATTRGIMFSELKGTFLQSAILPLIRPSDLKSHY